MAQSLAALFVHVVFSTKGRAPMITPELRQDLHRFLAGMAQARDAAPLGVGGTADHVHLLLALPPKVALSDLMRELKSGSSAEFRQRQAAFEWQRGYGAFSFSRADLPRLQQYVARQEEHHRTVSFQDEFLRLLNEHDVTFDARYLWNA